jgi:hypothetical protein
VGSIENPVYPGDPFEIETEITAEGIARKEAGEEPFLTIKLSVALTGAKEPDYYRKYYSSTYKLSGTEACAVLEVAFEACDGEIESIILQDAVLVRVADGEGNFYDGYQMMDSEIAGHHDVEVRPGETRNFYKRYAFRADTPMRYLVLTYYVNGEALDVYFTLKEPVVYEVLRNGDISEAVRALQARLVELGYLAGGADGIFGRMTENAIAKAQEAAGMEATGIADAAFQRYIFAE